MKNRPYAKQWDQETEEEEETDPRDETIVEPQVIASERSYQIEKRYIFKEAKERKEELLAQPEELGVTAEPSEPSTLPPSLANNPFYFGRLEDRAPQDKDSYESSKPKIIARLEKKKFVSNYARDLVNQSASEVDLIIRLMTKHKYTYSEAKKIVSQDAPY